MLTKTPKRRLYDANLTENKPYYIGNSDSVILMITVTTGATAGFITFDGTADENGFDPNQPASDKNFFTKVAVNDIDTGKTYEGSIGLSVATERLIMVEVNSRFLNFISVDTSMSNGAKFNIDVVCMQN